MTPQYKTRRELSLQRNLGDLQTELVQPSLVPKPRLGNENTRKLQLPPITWMSAATRPPSATQVASVVGYCDVEGVDMPDPGKAGASRQGRSQAGAWEREA